MRKKRTSSPNGLNLAPLEYLKHTIVCLYVINQRRIVQALPGIVLSRQKARKPPTNISVERRTVRIWSSSTTPEQTGVIIRQVCVNVVYNHKLGGLCFDMKYKVWIKAKSQNSRRHICYWRFVALWRAHSYGYWSILAYLHLKPLQPSTRGI